MSSQEAEALTLGTSRSDSQERGAGQSFGLVLDLDKHFQTGSQVQLTLQTARTAFTP